MSRTLTVAYSELTRVLPWSLRALGYPFGTADRGAHLIAAGAAMDPAVLDDVAKAARRPAHQFSYSNTEAGWSVDAAGISLLEVGPIAIDALAARARDNVSCRVYGATELSLLPATLVAAMDYNLCAIGIVKGNQGPRWYVVEPDAEGLLYSGHDFESLLSLLAGNWVVAELNNAGDLPPGTVLLIAGFARPEWNPTSHMKIRPRDEITAAYNKGIPISQQTLDKFYALEMLTWAPTSERSRAQAGFTIASTARS